MSKCIYEWKLDPDGDTCIWLASKPCDSESGVNGFVKVYLELGGMWKLSDKEKNEIFTGRDEFGHLNGRCAAELFNSQHEISRSKFGKMMVAEWERMGFPEIEEPMPPARAHEMPYAPIDVIQAVAEQRWKEILPP